MKKRRGLLTGPGAGMMMAAGLLFVLSAACGVPPVKLARGDSRLGFPLVEEGALALPEGVNLPMRTHAGSLLFTTRQGALYSVDVSYQSIVWTFRAEAGVVVPPEIGEDAACLLDQNGTLYRVDYTGRLLLKCALPAAPSTPVREYRGRICFGTADGRVFALDPAADGKPVWEIEAGSPIRAGPVFFGQRAIFGAEDGRIIALDAAGKIAWVFRARGAIVTDPAVAENRVYAGTTEGFYYGLEAKTGARKWTFRLGPEPLYAPEVRAKGLVVIAASNSVVYCLSGKSGEIRWWQGVPSRVVHDPLVAGGVLLVSSHSQDFAAYALEDGRSAGGFHWPKDLETGPAWIPPHLVLLGAAADSAAPTLHFLTREVVLTLASDLASPIAAGSVVEFSAAATGFDAPAFYEFSLVASGRRTLVRGPSSKNIWRWRPETTGRFTVVVRAFDRFRNREAEVSVDVEKRPGKA